jgi:serine/threonine protein kinase
VIGTTLAHYRITASLGKGGMGEVWRAEDTKLGREVALKVLPEEFGSDRERIERFEREARAVASLNHPHIVTLFSVEEIDDLRFLTMELVEGRTLDQMIPGNGFEAERFFDLATPLAEAMSAAHDKSVIHRDLKPSNVMVDDDGRVKVMDFGLAKLQENDDPSISSELPTEALTGVGMVVGTVPYMSPEQIEGKIVDHRTDVFSLGGLLYEMATGERPFAGESQPALMSSILRDAPQSVVEIRDDLPRHLGRVIGRCLEKDRRDRYQTARDVFNELRALQSELNSILAQNRRRGTVRSRQAPRPSSSSSEVRRVDVPWIAILPFGCPSGDGSVEAFADGLEEDIASGLSRFSYLFVVARKSTGRYRGEATDVRQVGEELGARFVMEGGIRRAGSTVRINVQIVDTETGTHLWAETFDRDLDETAIFGIQDDITDRVVATVADPYGVVARSMAIPTGAMKPEEMTAYQAVLRYFLYQQRLSQEDHLIAREALERAIEDEPGFADAWSCLALVVLDEDRHDFNRRIEPYRRPGAEWKPIPRARLLITRWRRSISIVGTWVPSRPTPKRPSISIAATAMWWRCWGFSTAIRVTGTGESSSPPKRWSSIHTTRGGIASPPSSISFSRVKTTKLSRSRRKSTCPVTTALSWWKCWRTHGLATRLLPRTRPARCCAPTRLRTCAATGASPRCGSIPSPISSTRSSVFCAQPASKSTARVARIRPPLRSPGRRRRRRLRSLPKLNHNW